jgi:hypothetical protein
LCFPFRVVRVLVLPFLCLDRRCLFLSPVHLLVFVLLPRSSDQSPSVTHSQVSIEVRSARVQVVHYCQARSVKQKKGIELGPISLVSIPSIIVGVSSGFTFACQPDRSNSNSIASDQTRIVPCLVQHVALDRTRSDIHCFLSSNERSLVPSRAPTEGQPRPAAATAVCYCLAT